MKKYEFTENTKEDSSLVLHQIRATRDIIDNKGDTIAKEGELGGWIEKEENLSHEGSCWVYGDAQVYDDAWIHGNARVYDDALICDNADVSDNAEVYGYACIYNNARVCGDARICDNARVYHNARVFGDAQVYDDAHIAGNARVYNKAKVYGNAEICGDAHIYSNAQVYGRARVCGDAKIFKDTDISERYHYITIGPIGSRNDYTTFYRTSNNTIDVKCGCFHGSIQDFRKKVKKTHGNSKYAKEYIAASYLAIRHIEL